MTSLAMQYSTEIAQGLKYLATWVPQTRLELGDIGTIEDSVFVPWSSLRAVGYDASRFGVTPWGPAVSFAYQSAGSVDVSFKAKGEVKADLPNVPKGSAGAAIRFGRGGAVFFSANGCRSRRLDDGLALRQRLLELNDRGLWNKDWVVVTEVVEAASATILVSSGLDASIELKAKGKVATVADLSAGVTAVNASGVQARIVAERRLTPLFHAVKVNKIWWHAVVESVSFGVEPIDYSSMLEPVDLGQSAA
jgi:hypothetical protein